MGILDPLGDGISQVSLIQHVGSDAMICNAARVSFANDTPRTDEENLKLLRYLLKHNHGSPVEHNLITFRIKAPLFLIQEVLRHRIGTCLTGDTVVTFVDTNGHRQPKIRKTMAELYRMWTVGEKHPCSKTGYRSQVKRVKNMNLRVLDESSNSFTTGHIEDVLYQGKQHVYTVTTEDGKFLSMTPQHRVLTPEGWQTMGDAVGLVGSGEKAIATKPCHLIANGIVAGTGLHMDKTWLTQQKSAGAGVANMAEASGCSYHTIRKWLKIHGLTFNHKERNAVHGEPWNKGKGGYKLEISPQGRLARSENGNKLKGKNNPGWKGGVTPPRIRSAVWANRNKAKVAEKFNYVCQKCNTPNYGLVVHHVLPVGGWPSKAMEFDNLTVVCPSCHIDIHRSPLAELEFASSVLAVVPEREGPDKQTTCLMGHPVKVTSVTYRGYEDTYDLCVGGPWHNFVANGLVVHNSVNQESHRYLSLGEKAPLEFYVPLEFRTQSKSNRQASGGALEDQGEARVLYLSSLTKAAYCYQHLLDSGVARELARGVLPHCTYSSLYFTVNLRSLFHFLELRLAAGAQWEIQQYAKCFLELAKPLFPLTFQAWEE
jgi:thymidylate synthase (FAD)